jgi:hypothetical protein
MHLSIPDIRSHLLGSWKLVRWTQLCGVRHGNPRISINRSVIMQLVVFCILAFRG